MYEIYIDGFKINEQKTLDEAMAWAQENFITLNYLRGFRVFKGNVCVFNGKAFYPNGQNNLDR